jgi:hypothetical protein
MTKFENDWDIQLAYAIFKPNPFSYEYPNHSQMLSLFTFLPMKMEQIECSETSAYKIQTPGNYPEEHIQHCNSLLAKKNKNNVLHAEPYRCICGLVEIPCREL